MNESKKDGKNENIKEHTHTKIILKTNNHEK